MLTPEMVTKLNKQLNLEYFSSNVYLQMSGWCEERGLVGAAAFLQKHSQEEMSHMQRIFSYVCEGGALPVIGKIDTPQHKFDNFGELLREIYKHELIVTKKVNKLAQEAFSSNDLTTFQFLQWFIAEQHEEENLIRHVLERFELTGEDGKGLFFIDQELGQLAKNGASL